MKNLLLDVLVWLIVSRLPVKVRVLARSLQRVVRIFLSWILKTIVIWEKNVRHDIEE